MPEEKPAEAQPAAPAATPASAPKKKTNAGVIILIVVLVIVILGGGISYGVYRFVKNRVKNAVTSVTGVNTDTTNVGTDTADFSALKDTTPTETLPKTVNDTIKPILKRLFGDAKLSMWSSIENGGTLAYTLRDNVETADYTVLEAAIVSAGYTQNSVYNSSESFLAYYTKGDIEISIGTASSNANEVSVVLTQNTTSASE